VAHEVEKLYFPFFVGTYEYKGQSYDFAIDGKDAENIFSANKPASLNQRKATSTFYNIVWAPTLLLVLAVLAVVLFEMSLSLLMDLIVRGAAWVSLVALPLTIIIGRIRKKRFMKWLAAQKEVVKQAVYSEAGPSQIALTLDRKTKKVARTSRVNNLLILVCMAAILATGPFIQGEHSRFVFAARDLEVALDVPVQNIQRIFLMSGESERVRIDIAYDQLDSEDLKGQLADLLYQTHSFFEEREVGFTSYHIFAVRPDGAHVMQAQWPDPMADDRTNYFVIWHYWADGTRRAERGLPFPYR